MAPVTFYYAQFSPAVRSVDLIIHALDIPVEYKHVNLFQQEHLKPEYEKVNPVRTVPTIVEEDGFVLWESRAILTYLVSKYAKDDSLYPTDLRKRAIVDQRLHYSNDLYFIGRAIGKGFLFYGKKTIPEDQALQLQTARENVESFLSEHDFIAGDSLTVADYSYITLMDVGEFFMPEKMFPLTTKWMARCRELMKDFDEVVPKGAQMYFEAIRAKIASP